MRSPGLRTSGQTDAVVTYEPLFHRLRAVGDGPVEMTFADVDELVGGLPASARRYSAWWLDASSATTHVQARAWLDGGRRVEGVDLTNGTVRFTRAEWQRGL